MTPEDRLDLADYRRRTAAMYARAREAAETPADGWLRFRRERDRLFAEHPQSALRPADQESFQGLDYYPYDPGWRKEAQVIAEPDRHPLSVALEEDGEVTLEPVGGVRFPVEGKRVELRVYWLRSYGGGLFLPFRDATNGHGTYGGGRYLLDTIKGADLGTVEGRLLLDFNFAYNPSCAYNPRWHCPLAPPENWLEVPVEAGEKQFGAEHVAEGPDETAIPRPGA